MSLDAYPLPARSNADAAHALLDAARAALPQGRFAVDAGAVEALDGPTVFVLASAARSYRDRGGAVAVANASPAFVEGFSDLGLYEDLMRMEFVK